MLRTVLKSKVHRATVTHADLHYIGSLTIDESLIEAAGIVEGEQVHVVNVTNGARLVTYALEGAHGSGVDGVNGRGARLMHVGDEVIVIAYAMVEADERLTPSVVLVDERNRAVELGHALNR